MNDNVSKVYSVITDKIIELMDKGVVPWHMPWQKLSGMPANLRTKIPYKGVNTFLLAVTQIYEGYSSPYWLSYKQVKDAGGKIKDDQYHNYTPVIFSKPKPYVEERKSKDEDGNVIIEQIQKNIWITRYYNVWNTDQCNGLEERLPELKIERHDHSPIEICEEILLAMPNPPDIKHNGSQACYIPSLDLIKMPEMSVCNSPEDYYCTRFHETAHSTGHQSRLNRNGIIEGHSFGDREYSREELIAEMTAAFLCGVAGIENNTIENSAAYIDNWKKKLKEDTKCVVIAAAQAEKAADYILNRQRNNN